MKTKEAATYIAAALVGFTKRVNTQEIVTYAAAIFGHLASIGIWWMTTDFNIAACIFGGIVGFWLAIGIFSVVLRFTEAYQEWRCADANRGVKTGMRRIRKAKQIDFPLVDRQGDIWIEIPVDKAI